MLKLLDVIIGVVTVMLLYSMVVTVITQFITSVIRSRGRNLCAGIAGLLHQIDPGMDQKIAQSIATAVLKHPLIGGRFGAMGTVVHRGELTMLLMELAAGQTPNNLAPIEKAALNQMLRNNNISDPAGTLSNIRNVALQLEASSPQLASDVRHSIAILQEAKSEFVAKIHGWFDQTIDRVSQRFTVTAHGITFVAALAVAFAAQLDVIALVNRLSLDDAFRDAVVSEAKPLIQQASILVNQGTAGTAASPTSGGADLSTSGTNPSAQPVTPPANTNKKDGSDKNPQSPEDAQKQLRKLLGDNGLIPPPEAFKTLLSPPDWLRILGILLSALLLSLGAPFWYNALQNLLKLRSTLSQKDDQQRTTRQTTQDDGTTSASAASTQPSLLQGEQGDLKALG